MDTVIHPTLRYTQGRFASKACRETMFELVRLFVQIAVLRRGPQDVPASYALLGLLLFAQWTLGIVADISHGESLAFGVLSNVLLSVLLLLYVHLVLKLHHHPRRFVQTVTAIAGVELLIMLLYMPALLFASGATLSFITMLVLFWNFTVVAHVFQHALETTLDIGFLWALAYIFLPMLLLMLVMV